ncbi:heme exporter protein CcmD [Enterobacter soli]|uniref:heme exporter protein CcmD n=1 Tax=Enterobacter soli TaxID=885040 RepID=UPI0034CD48C1
MTSAFSSWAAFFSMGGYAFYVWLSFALTLIPLAALTWHSEHQHRALLRSLNPHAEKEKG